MLTLTALMHTYYICTSFINGYMFYPFIHSNPKTQFIIGTVTLLLTFMGFLSFHPQTRIYQVNTVDTVLNVASVEYIGQQRLAPLIC